MKIQLGIPEVRQAILQRVNELVDRDLDRRFANPADASLGAYLLILSEGGDRAAAIGVASRILSCEGCWWSPQSRESDRVDVIGKSSRGRRGESRPSSAPHDVRR